MASAKKRFNQQGEETSIVRADDRAGRRGTKWFSFDVPLDGSAANVLVVTYQTDNRRIRTFDILIEGQRLASQTLEPNGESRFFDVEYRLPPALVAGKPKATVRFEATNGNEIGAVFGVRTNPRQRTALKDNQDQFVRASISESAARSSARVRRSRSR